MSRYQACEVEKRAAKTAGRSASTASRRMSRALGVLIAEVAAPSRIHSATVRVPPSPGGAARWRRARAAGTANASRISAGQTT